MSEPESQMIFCPKCGNVFNMVQVKPVPGYVAIYSGSCKCGVSGVLSKKALPAEPTFTLQFNIYEMAKAKSVEV